MIKTMIVGNVLYGLVAGGCWFALDGDRAKFVAALVLVTITFAAGIATGIVANQPKKVKRYSLRGAATTVPASDAFDFICE